MSNVKSYSAYAASTRLPVLMDGITFAELLLLNVYDKDMFEATMSMNVRYYVPRFSFETAMQRMLPGERNLIQDILDRISHKHYELFNPANDIPIEDEECRFVSAAIEFHKNMKNMTMQVSSARIWQIYRKAVIQATLDNDLL